VLIATSVRLAVSTALTTASSTSYSICLAAADICIVQY
jgi:hypothetical protein